MRTGNGDSQKPRRGDVVEVTSGEPARPDGHGTGPLGVGPPPGDNDRVRIRLHGHPCSYVVRVSTSPQTGPQLTELTIVADEGQTVDYDTVRAVPTRRLAHSARRWIERWGGVVASPSDTPETFTRPEQPQSSSSKVQAAARSADRALALGLPVRPTVAADLHVSKTTVDRLLKQARDQGLIEDQPLPKRPPPQQRDWSTAATTTDTEESE